MSGLQQQLKSEDEAGAGQGKFQIFAAGKNPVSCYKQELINQETAKRVSFNDFIEFFLPIEGMMFFLPEASVGPGQVHLPVVTTTCNTIEVGI